MSPILFIIVMDEVIKELKRKYGKINALDCADDLIILGERETKIQAKLYLWQEEFWKMEMNISRSKAVGTVMIKNLRKVHLKLKNETKKLFLTISNN